MQKPIIEQERGVTIVCPGPDFQNIFESAIPQFDDTLNLASSIDPPLLILDLQNTQYFCSKFLELLVRIANRLKVQRSGAVGLCQLTKTCEAILNLARLDKMYERFDSREEAVAAFAIQSDSPSSPDPSPTPAA